MSGNRRQSHGPELRQNASPTRRPPSGAEGAGYQARSARPAAQARADILVRVEKLLDDAAKNHDKSAARFEASKPTSASNALAFPQN